MIPRKKAKNGNEFVFCNGRKSGTIASLKKEIKSLSEDEFSFHINQEKNDFYNWIKNCINQEYAENISGFHEKKELLSLLK